MWFKKKKVKEIPQSSHDAALDNMCKIMDELVEQSNKGVLRTDMFVAYLKALIDLHPECQSLSNV